MSEQPTKQGTCGECGVSGGKHRAPGSMPIAGCSRYVPVGGDFNRRVAGAAYAEGGQAERAAVVAWLREQGGVRWWIDCADAARRIENGEHLKAPTT